jgi:hypothetical protein
VPLDSCCKYLLTHLPSLLVAVWARGSGRRLVMGSIRACRPRSTDPFLVSVCCQMVVCRRCLLSPIIVRSIIPLRRQHGARVARGNAPRVRSERAAAPGARRARARRGRGRVRGAATRRERLPAPAEVAGGQPVVPSSGSTRQQQRPTALPATATAMGQGAPAYPGQRRQPALQWPSQVCGPAPQPAHRYVLRFALPPEVGGRDSAAMAL